jgi:hypothetical protein
MKKKARRFNEPVRLLVQFWCAGLPKWAFTLMVCAIRILRSAGGINTFFNLNEPTALRAIEIQRSPNTAQFGSMDWAEMCNSYRVSLSSALTNQNGTENLIHILQALICP